MGLNVFWYVNGATQKIISSKMTSFVFSRYLFWDILFVLVDYFDERIHEFYKRTYSISAIDFGFVPYPLASLNSNSPHLSSLN